jgi:hypothetical protein
MAMKLSFSSLGIQIRGWVKRAAEATLSEFLRVVRARPLLERVYITAGSGLAIRVFDLEWAMPAAGTAT